MLWLFPLSDVLFQAMDTGWGWKKGGRKMCMGPWNLAANLTVKFDYSEAEGREPIAWSMREVVFYPFMAVFAVVNVGQKWIALIIFGLFRATRWILL